MFLYDLVGLRWTVDNAFRNEKVAGSIPVSGTNKINWL